MKTRKKVGVYALVALGLVLAMGFAPMERGMAADTAAPETQVMDDILIESYGGALFIVISGVDLGDFDGILVLVIEGINAENLESLMEYLGLDEYIPYVMDDILIESLPDTVILILEDEDIADMAPGTEVPLVMDDILIESYGIIVSPLVMDDILIEDVPNIVPYVMDDILIE